MGMRGIQRSRSGAVNRGWYTPTQPVKSLLLLTAVLLIIPAALPVRSCAASKKAKPAAIAEPVEPPKAAKPGKKPPKPPEEAWPTGGGFIPPSTEPGGEFEAGRSMYASGLHREAMLMASSLLAIDSSHAGAWHLLGNCRWALGERVAAKEAWARSVKLQPNAALAAYAKSKKITGPPPVPQAYRTALIESLAAKALLASKQPEAAARRAEAAAQLDPLSPAEWDLLGDCRKAARDPDGARAAWTRAAKLAPKDKSIKEKLLGK